LRNITEKAVAASIVRRYIRD